MSRCLRSLENGFQNEAIDWAGTAIGRWFGRTSSLFAYAPLRRYSGSCALKRLIGTRWWFYARYTIPARNYINQSSGHNIIQTRSIEVVDWEENVPDIMEVIRKKCGRAYPDYYSLVVRARHVGKVVNFANVSEELKAIHVPFMDIWGIASAGADNLIVARVAPDFFENRFSLLNRVRKG